MPSESKDTTRVDLQLICRVGEKSTVGGDLLGSLMPHTPSVKISVAVHFINFHLSLDKKASLEKLGILSSN